MPDTTPTTDRQAAADLTAAREAVENLVNLFFDRVPIEEFIADLESGREQLAECIHEGLSDEFDRLYRIEAAHEAAPARLVLGTTDQQPETVPVPVDRAAVLTEAERTMLTYAVSLAQERVLTLDGFTAESLNALTSLRRMADEAQQPETEAWPTETEWIGEVLEVDAWMYLGASPDRSVAEKRRASVTRRHPDAQTRTVRKTTAYTVAADQPDTETEAAK